MSTPTITKLEFDGYQMVRDADADVVERDVHPGPCTLHAVDVDNTANGAASYLKLFNNINPVLGTTDPDEVYLIPASVKRTIPCNPQATGKSGVPFDVGLSFACVTAGGTAGTTAPTSAVPVVLTITEGVS